MKALKIENMAIVKLRSGDFFTVKIIERCACETQK